MRHTQRERERERERQRHRQKEKQASRREPNVGLDPGTPGSHLEPKANTQPLSHPGVPGLLLNQNNVHAKVAYHGIACLCPLQ